MIEQELQSIQKFYNLVIEFFVTYSFQIVGAVIILLIGIFVAKRVGRLVESFLTSKEFDVTLTKFIAAAVKISIIIGVAIIALGKVGITITPFVAAIGAVSLGAGLAFQGLLSNYAAGVSIIATRPFVVGNTIKVHEYTGVVKEVNLGHTLLETEEKEIITVPNKHILGEVLTNSFEYTVVEMMVGIDYSCSPHEAIRVLNGVLDSCEELSKESKAQVGIKEFGDFSINIELRYWAPTQKYNETQYKINLGIYEALKEEGITIPFPTHNIIKQG